MAPPPQLWKIPHPWGLSIGTLNIRDGRISGLAQVIRLVHISGFGLMILTETKITDQDYCLRSLGYDVV